jgi:hypothetical protein
MVWGLAVFSNDTRDELLERMAEHAILKAREAQEEREE